MDDGDLFQGLVISTVDVGYVRAIGVYVGPDPSSEMLTYRSPRNLVVSEIKWCITASTLESIFTRCPCRIHLVLTYLCPDNQEDSTTPPSAGQTRRCCERQRCIDPVHEYVSPPFFHRCLFS